MKYGWLKINIADMWADPKYNSERVNQLLFADTVKILDEKDRYLLVEKNDKYQGWVDSSYLNICTLKAFTAYNKQNKYIVTNKFLKVHQTSQSVYHPIILFYGTKLTKTKVAQNKVKIKLPDENTLEVSASGIQPVPVNQTPSSNVIIHEAKKFLGVPYLWGGLSSNGLDCSGLVQLVLSRFGIQVPRDTSEQIHIGSEVKREDIQSGDLIFFKRHVGIAIGKHTIIHSSIGGGGVRINSIDPSKSEYRKDLDESYQTTRRIL